MVARIAVETALKLRQSKATTFVVLFQFWYAWYGVTIGASVGNICET